MEIRLSPRLCQYGGKAIWKVRKPAQHGAIDATAFPCDFITGPPARSYAAIVPQVGYLEASTAAIHEWVGIAVYWMAGKLAFP